MGKTEVQNEFRELSDYVYRSTGISYQAQAERLGLSPARISSMRTDTRYTVTAKDVQDFRHEFRRELQGFGEPTDLEKELIRYKELYEQALAAGSDKDRVIVDLSAALAEITAQIRKNKGEEE